jgi:hypothetical protein
LIDSNHTHADLFVRQPDGCWALTSIAKPQDVIELSSCDCRLKMADLYVNVEFSALGAKGYS